MKTQTVYLDTSVIGGCFDDEFSTWSNGIISDIENGVYRGATSEIVAAELHYAPPKVKAKYQEFISLETTVVEVNEQAEMLADAYIGHRILTEKFRNDMLHIAVATAHNVDILVSWNFKHIVHYDKIVKFNAVNMEYGFRQLAILSPREVTTHE